MVMDHEEMQAVSIDALDATLRCCLPIMGQVHPRAQKKIKDQTVFAQVEACDSLSLGLSFAASNTSATKCEPAHPRC